MKCQATSDTTHDVLIGKEVGYKSYKEICSGEPKKVNMGFNYKYKVLKVENNTLTTYPQSCADFPFKPTDDQDSNPCVHGSFTHMSSNWEILSKFFSIHNIEPNWRDCNYVTGDYDEELGGWTGCIGQV